MIICYKLISLKKTATWTYNGPDKIWIFVNKDTNKWVNGTYLTEDDDGANVPTPLDKHKVMIDCSVNPELCHIFGADEYKDYGQLPALEETLPCGGTYIRPEVMPPDHTYEWEDLIYDPESLEFVKPYPWKRAHVTWNEIRQWRNGLLFASDDIANAEDVPAELKAQWEDYRQKLRDLPQTHGAQSKTDTPTTAPWKIAITIDPSNSM